MISQWNLDEAKIATEWQANDIDSSCSNIRTY